jgi:hypothetical protein
MEYKVGPFACTLGKYLKPVPEAWSLVKTYRVLRITTLSLVVGGLALMSSGIYLSIKQDAQNPLLVPGIGLTLSSALPNEISKFLISKAVEKYNQVIKKRK